MGPGHKNHTLLSEETQIEMLKGQAIIDTVKNSQYGFGVFMEKMILVISFLTLVDGRATRLFLPAMQIKIRPMFFFPTTVQILQPFVIHCSI